MNTSTTTAASPLESLIACGTKLWLDSIDPELVKSNFALGASGATSNPAIIADLLRTGRFDDGIRELMSNGSDDHAVAWKMTDRLVSEAQAVFHSIWKSTEGNDGYVSYELDPLIEDTVENLPHKERVARYIKQGVETAHGQDNRMVKVPATPAGIEAIEELAAAGVTLNITLIFTMRQYEAARDAVWRGVQRLPDTDGFKSAYSVFVSRVDAYGKSELTDLSAEAAGLLGIVNAKQIWQANQEFWKQHPTKLQQEIIFASTGTKDPADPAWKYVEALAGSDIQTNPPSTNDQTQASGVEFASRITELPGAEIQDEIERIVDWEVLENVLMDQGISKFANPQKELLALIAEKRSNLE